MIICSKIGLLRVLLTGICMLLIFDVWINYFSYRQEEQAAASTFSRLSIRNVYKYAKVQNHSSPAAIAGILTPPALRTRSQIHYLRHTASSMYVGNIANNNSNNNSSTNTSQINNNNVTVSIFQHHEHHEFAIRPPKYLSNLLGTQDEEEESTVPGDSPVTTTMKTVITNKNSTNHHNAKLPVCIDPTATDGIGPITANMTLVSLDIVEAGLGPLLHSGGAFEPSNCLAKHHVAIIVPFRDRYAHLSIFLHNIHPFLMRQRIAYRIFIVEQTNGQPFNRAALMNIGFLEALKIYKWDCFIFHDVDLLPLDDRNLYNCPNQPRHMSVAIDTLNYKLPYRTIFGGVSAMRREHFLAVNGFSNSFFGWGGEDDDMSNRLKHANLFISRYSVNIARYKMLRHPKEKANPKRFENLVNGIGKMEMDGLNSIKYDIYSIKEFRTFTWYLAELKISNDQKSSS